MNNDRISKAEHYLREYQRALRDFRSDFPEDGDFDPYAVAASIGRVELYSCKDAAIALTFQDDSAEVTVEVKESVELSATQFTNESEVFRYFDRYGDPSSVRLTYNEDIPDASGVSKGFLRKKYDNTDLIAWAEDLSTMTARGYKGDEFFRPQFKRISILGWESFHGDPRDNAAQYIHESFAFRNLLGFPGSQAAGRKRTILEESKRLISEFETLLDSDESLDALKGFFNEHPDLLQIGYTRRYEDPSIGGRRVGDFLLTHWRGEPTSVCVMIGEPNVEFFGAGLEPLESLTALKLEVNETLEHLKSHKDVSTPDLPTGTKIEYIVVSGRSSGFSFAERKELRETHFVGDLTFLTYDHLLNRFKAGVRELSGSWRDFESVSDRLRRLGVADDRVFDETMQAVDADMERDEVPIPARPLEGWLRFSSTFGLYLTNRDPLSEKILKWFDVRFGDRLKIDPTWKFPVSVKDRIWQMRIPLIFGSVQFICFPNSFGTTESTASPKETPPVVNVLDLVDGFSKERVKKLDPHDCFLIFSQFSLGIAVRSSLDRLGENSLVRDAMERLENCTRLALAVPPDVSELGQQAWAAIRRLLEAFIVQRKAVVEGSPELERLADQALSLGLRSGTRERIKALENISLQPTTGEKVTAEAIIRFVHAADLLSSEIADEIYLVRNFTLVAELTPGEFYTNRLGKTYRCMSVDSDIAEILMLDEITGKTLDVLFTQTKAYWDEYYRIDDESSLTVLQRRYESWESDKDQEGDGEQKPKDDVVPD